MIIVQTLVVIIIITILISLFLIIMDHKIIEQDFQEWNDEWKRKDFE